MEICIVGRFGGHFFRGRNAIPQDTQQLKQIAAFMMRTTAWGEVGLEGVAAVMAIIRG